MRRQYRIAMVAPGPFPGPRGSQVLVRELAESLVALGHTVHVIAYGVGDRAIGSLAGIHVHRTPSILGGAGLVGPHPWRMVLNLFLLLTLYRVMREQAVHVIHAHNYEAPILGYAMRAMFGVPVVYHAHNLLGDELERYFRGPRRRRLATRFGRLLDRTVPRRADRVVALSEPMAEELRRNGVASERLDVIPPGVFARAPGEGRPVESPGRRKTIAYAGNADPYQDLQTLVRAMDSVHRADPDIDLLLLTHAPAPEIQRQVRSLGLGEVIEVRRVESYEQVHSLLCQADLLVCPRSSWSGFPIKLLNYMNAGGLMVIADGAAKALGKGPWIVARDGDSESLAAAILTALSEPGLGGRLGGEARRIARDRYDWSHLAPRIEAVYDRVVPPPSAAARNTSGREKVLQKAAV